MLRRALTLVLTAAVSASALLITAFPAQAAQVTVTNATQFTDTTGAVVHAHGGGVIKVGSSYYWFGENRNADNTFKAVSAYRSTDLKTWEFRNDVLTQSSAPELNVANIERPKVIFNSTTGKFVLWMHKENGSDYTQSRAAVAVSDTVDGDYTWQGSFRPPTGTTSRDMTLFKDDNGTAYQITSAAGNADLQIWKLNADYSAYDSLTANPWPGTFREAPALFKRNGVYFMLTSGNSGWKPNQQKYATASSIAGPWTAMTDIGDYTGYDSQTTFVLPVQGTSGTSYLYMGDRWGNSMGGTVNDSQYVWLPLTFPTKTTMNLPWYPQVAIDTTAGTVTGVGGGPYYDLVARHSGKCLDISDNSAADSAVAVQYTCIGGLNQQWRLQDAGDGYVRVLAQHSGKCLDVANNSTADGAFVNQYRCGTGTNQQFQFQDQGNGYYRLMARHSGKCLDVSNASTVNGARLIQWPCGTGTNQQFQRRTA
ncbi:MULTISPECIES: RICIN domain-containing protein [unclassified Streptomyces]|uniref:RICIN domain-containing protein n=1 Tax=unclassified Streptomyces TaxID=2593676 RepID=UPI002E22AE84